MALLLFLGLVAVLIGGLLAQAVWSSTVGAWIALGALAILVVGRFVAWLPFDAWPFDGGDDG